MNKSRVVPSNHFGSMRPYIIGFVLSLVLTFGSYFIATQDLLHANILIIVLLLLGVLQLIVQLLFFLHLGQEKSPRWNLIFFVMTVGIVLLVVVGSIWIMHNLNYNMSGEMMNQYLYDDEGINK